MNPPPTKRSKGHRIEGKWDRPTGICKCGLSLFGGEKACGNCLPESAIELLGKREDTNCHMQLPR